MNKTGAISTEGRKDRRRAPRRRIFKGAVVVSLDKMWSVGCTLKSLSREGALISGPPVADLPDQFYVRAPVQLRLVRCEVVRRNATSLAVRFQGKPGKLVDGL